MNIKSLKDIRQKKFGKIVIGHLNIDSFRQKFDRLTEFTTGYIDMIMISETKLDGGEFLIKGFSDSYTDCIVTQKEVG